MNDLQTEIRERVLTALSRLTVDCPECESMYDDQYQCGSCGAGSGNGKISVMDYLKENTGFKDDDLKKAK